MSISRVLVFGASGALGSSVMNAFRGANWNTHAVDFVPGSTPASLTTVLKVGMTSQQMIESVLNDAKSSRYDAVINVAGGWVGGGIADKGIAAAWEASCQQSIVSSLVTSHIASCHGNKGVLLVLTGSEAALHPTPQMIAYGTAKAAVHHIVRSIAQDRQGLPEGGSVIGVLPQTLDTPGNRAAMPGADTSSWTPTSFVADELLGWAAGKVARPKSGGLAIYRTSGGKTVVEIV